MMMPVSHSYYDFASSIYYNAFKTHRNQYYDQRFLTPQSFAPSYYPTQSCCQAALRGTNGYPIDTFNQYAGLTLNSMALIGSGQQPYSGFAKNDFSLSSYAGTLPAYDQSNTMRYYATGTQASPFPAIQNLSDFRPASSGRLGYWTLPSFQYPAWAHTNQLPPKIGVIFTPPSQSCFQQACSGPLTIPPFFFNCMTQPRCSLPLPPPLPHVSSLPPEFSFPQKIVEQYANPVALFPATTHWPSCQSCIPNQQSAVQWQPQAMSPQSWALSAYTPQPCAPPAALPSAYSYSVPSINQPSFGDCSNTCYPCAIAQPPANPPVRDCSSTLQDSTRCCLLPAAPTSKIGTAHARMTSPPRHPAVVQRAPDRGKQQRRDFYANAARVASRRPFNLPPLPPGAVIISDEYIDRTDPSPNYDRSKNSYSDRDQGTHQTTLHPRASPRSDVFQWTKLCKRRSSGNHTDTSSSCSSDYSSTCYSCTSSSSSSHDSLINGFVNYKPAITSSFRRKPVSYYRKPPRSAPYNPLLVDNSAFHWYSHGHNVEPSSETDALLNSDVLVPAEKNSIEPLSLNYSTQGKNEKANFGDIISKSPQSNVWEQQTRNSTDEEQEWDSVSLASIATRD